MTAAVSGAGAGTTSGRRNLTRRSFDGAWSVEQIHLPCAPRGCLFSLPARLHVFALPALRDCRPAKFTGSREPRKE
jgi:hypothetical protein